MYKVFLKLERRINPQMSLIILIIDVNRCKQVISKTSIIPQGAFVQVGGYFRQGITLCGI